MTETWDTDRKLGALERMLVIRRFEEAVDDLFHTTTRS